MTISESIIEWIRNFDGFDISETIENELLGGTVGANTLSKTPTNSIKTFSDGSQCRTEYYSFYAKRSSQFEEERISNDKFFEELENWIDERNYSEDYPVLDNKRICEDISVSSGFYLFETEEAEGVYMLTIQIEYRKER